VTVNDVEMSHLSKKRPCRDNNRIDIVVTFLYLVSRNYDDDPTLLNQ